MAKTKVISISAIPLEYKSLMEQCWDADPTLYYKMREIRKSYYQNTSNKSNGNKNIIKIFFKNFNLFKLSKPKTNNNSEINNSTNLRTDNTASKIYQFENLPEPINAAEGIIFYFKICY